MTSPQTLLPELRFRGFSDEWKQRRLGDILKYEQPQAYIVESTEYDNNNKTPVLTAGQSFILGYTDEEFGIKEASEKTPVIIFDDFMTTTHYVDFPFKIKSSAMKLLTVRDRGKDNFYFAYMVLDRVDYIVQNHERHWISKFAEFNVLTPSYEEQAKIAKFLYRIDRLITYHQRKYDRLKNVKKSMLEKMFPRDGSNVPEIRFAGFTNPWEQRKLGDLVQFSKGTGYSKSDLKESGTPIILYGRLYTKYETVIANVDTFADSKPGSVYSRGGEVIVPASGETAEDISIASVVEKSGVLLGGDLNIITPSTSLDSAFLAISISNGKPHDDMAKMAQGKSVVHLHNTDLEKIDLAYPSYEEQMQISSYFKRLDHLITLHQRKYEKLQQIKKSMLEKMFV